MVGGFAGSLSTSTFTNVYARGAVTGVGVSVGGLVGSIGGNSTAVNSFWDVTTSGQASSLLGTGLTSVPMKTRTVFTNAGWNFTTIWGCYSLSNAGYPYLRFASDAEDCGEAVVAEVPSSSSGGGSRPRTTTAPIQVVTPSETGGSGVGQVNLAIRDLILKNRSLFEVAKKAGITLPALITNVLDTTAPPSVNPTVLLERDLFRGMEGEDVRALQVLLINHNTGPKALELKRVTATGFFINYTEEALIEYQTKYGIAPATGYFGPASRAQIKAAGLPGLWW